MSRDVVFHDTIFLFCDVKFNPMPSPFIPLPIEDHPRYNCTAPQATPTTQSPKFASIELSQGPIEPQPPPPSRIQTYHRWKSIPITPIKAQSMPSLKKHFRKFPPPNLPLASQESNVNLHTFKITIAQLSLVLHYLLQRIPNRLVFSTLLINILHVGIYKGPFLV